MLVWIICDSRIGLSSIYFQVVHRHDVRNLGLYNRDDVRHVADCDGERGKIALVRVSVN